jgi:hypothetical protein
VTRGFGRTSGADAPHPMIVPQKVRFDQRLCVKPEIVGVCVRSLNLSSGVILAIRWLTIQFGWHITLFDLYCP